MTIKAVFFDMGGTLERFWGTPESRLQTMPGINQLLLASGIDLGLNEQELLVLVGQGYKRYHNWTVNSMQELPTLRVWSEFILAGQPVDPGKLASVAEDLMVTLEEGFYQRELRPEVPAVLEEIRRMGLHIGLVSNVCSLSLVPKNLDLYGIRNYFDPIVLSSEYGRRKPDPSIFHYAARLANVPTGACAYVGDRIARDVAGSRRAGFHLAVQIINDFDHGEDDSGAHPDAVITRMDQLLEILKAEMDAAAHARQEANAGEDQICALLFDAGDILYHRPLGNRNLEAFLTEIGLSAVKIPEGKRKELKNQAFNGSISQAQYRQATLGLYGITAPDLLERGSRAIDEDENGVQIFPGVKDTLTSLKEQGFLLGIITDTANPIHVKLAWFERGGIENVWDCFISSKEIGVEKPDPRIYAAALQQLGITAKQAVFVGHNPAELSGAQAVGMKTVAFNYEESTQADYYIEKFEDLLKVPVLDVEISPR